MKYPKNTILVVGQAKPSREDAIYNTHGEFYISMVLEPETGLILDVECNTILEVTRSFVADLFIGRSLKDDVAELEREIRGRYFALTQKPLIACMKDAQNRYFRAVGQTAPGKETKINQSDSREYRENLYGFPIFPA